MSQIISLSLFRLLILAIALCLAGCASLGNRIEGKLEAVGAAVNYIAAAVPEEEDAKATVYREFSVNPFWKLNITATGCWRDGDYFRADSFDVSGRWLNYKGAPFAWKLDR